MLHVPCCEVCVVFVVVCSLYCVLCIVYCVLCVVYCVLCIVYCALCTLHSALCTLHSALCTLHSALCTLHSALCTVHCALCTSVPDTPHSNTPYLSTCTGNYYVILYVLLTTVVRIKIPGIACCIETIVQRPTDTEQEHEQDAFSALCSLQLWEALPAPERVTTCEVYGTASTWYYSTSLFLIFMLSSFLAVMRSS